MLPHIILFAGPWLPEQGINIMAQTEAGHFFRIHYDRALLSKEYGLEVCSVRVQNVPLMEENFTLHLFLPEYS